MARINPVSAEKTDPKAAQILKGVEKSFGLVPNGMATMANSPAVLGAYLGFGQALGGGSLSGALREQIALTVAGENSCGYCASAHTALGKGQGVADDELARNLHGDSSDAKTQSALAFSSSIVEKRGWVSDDDLKVVRDAGYTEGEIVEIIATVAATTFTNYFNHIAQTEVDFPVVELDDRVAA